MKLQTSIQPRRDGGVVVLGQDRKAYTFAPGQDGLLECEIEHVETVKHLLRTENFFPVNAEDYDFALALARPDSDLDDAPDGRESSLKSDDDLDLDDDEGNPDAMPVEAETPPKAAPDKAAKSNARARAAAAK